MSTKTHTGIVLLAAGASSRMKKNKLLVEFNGKTLLENSILSAINSQANEVVLVLGANTKDSQQIVENFDLVTVQNTNWEQGIGSSIKCGIKHLLEEKPELDAIIISVCDQPFLSFQVFDDLIYKHKETKKKIIASYYSDSIGVPVLYDKLIFSDLLKLPDEHGAKKHILVNAEKGIISTISFPKGKIDIDTSEDLEKLTQT